MRNDRGIVLVAVLAIIITVMLLGVAAIKMSELGYLAYGSERRYQIANSAAEYSINAGIYQVASSGTCPTSGTCSGTLASGGVNASYSCITTTDSNGSKCMIMSTGRFGLAKVVKVVVLPVGILGVYGAIGLRGGGSVDFGGSSAVVSCDASCATPGIKFGGTLDLTVSGLYTLSACEKNPKGVYGAPYAVVDGQGNQAYCADPKKGCSFTKATLDDYVSKIFSISDAPSGIATDWDKLSYKLGGTYNGKTVTVYDDSSPRDPTKDLTVSGLPTPPTVIADCTCACNVVLGAGSTQCCSGGALKNISGCGQINVTGTLEINGIPANITGMVTTGNVTVQGVSAADGNFQGKSIYATGTATITVNDPDVALNNSNLLAAGSIALQSMKDISNNSLVVSEANLTVNTANGVSNSMIVGANTSGTVSVVGGTVTQSAVVTNGTLAISGSAGLFTDSYLFSNTTTVSKGEFSGGTLYSKSNTTINDSNGNQNFGTSANPVLLLVGGDLINNHETGTAEFNGLIFVNGEFKTSKTTTGNYNINGAVIVNATTAGSEFKGKGNALISFDDDIINTVASRTGGLLKSVSCGGGGNVSPYVLTTKMTVY
jgi:hypothetical protein